MKPVIINILKNVIILAVLLVSVFSFFQRIFTWHDFLLFQMVSGLAYVFLSCYEYLNTSYKAMVPVSRFTYLPYKLFMFSFLKAGFFISMALMLISSASRIQFLYPICFIIATTELIILALRYFKRLYFISVYANYILISVLTMKKIFASEIDRIEFRHEIIYLVQKNGKSEMIKLHNIENQAEFYAKIISWIELNSIRLSEESRVNFNKWHPAN